MFDLAMDAGAAAATRGQKSLAGPKSRARTVARLGAAWVAVALASSPVVAQQRLLLPEGTVLTVQTETPLSSQSAEVGQVFSTIVTDSVRVDGFTVIPEGSRIEGEVTMARAATSRESGMIGVEFSRLVFPNSRAMAIAGKLHSIRQAGTQVIGQMKRVHCVAKSDVI